MVPKSKILAHIGTLFHRISIIRFTLQPSETGTAVTVSPISELKYGPIGNLIDRFFVKKPYEKGMHALLAGLKKFVENGR
ncbi:MAG: hypothetical protein DWQ04_26360 [Chloroflexi bacterium]|nr:MAG: hypothetical protein DWQ04_26360 [Chloroflexota bacterium]